MVMSSGDFGLPMPGPRLRAAFVGVWLVLLALVIAGTLGEGRTMLVWGADSAHGWLALGIQRGGDNNDEATLISAAAARAGVRAGDRLIAIDGLDPATATIEALEPHLIASEGQRVRVTVRTPGAPPRDIVLVHRADEARAMLAPAGLTPDALVALSTAAFMAGPLGLVLGALLLFTRRREPVAALMSLSLMALAAVAGNQSAWWQDIGQVWVATSLLRLAGGGLALAFLAFPDGRFVPGWSRWIALVLPPLVLATGIAPVAALWIVLALVFVAFGVLIVRYRGETPEQRRQWRWVLLGFGVALAVFAFGLSLGTIAEALRLPFAVVAPWSWITTPAVFTLMAWSIAGGLVLSLLRYRLYDAPVVIGQSLIYGTLTLALLAIFAGTEKVIEIIGEEMYGESIGALAGGLGAAFAAVAIGPLHHRISHMVDHRFRGNLLRLRQEAPGLIAELGETADAATLAATIAERLRSVLDVSGVSVALGADTIVAGSVPDHAAIRLPLGPDAALAVGARPDGSRCDREERAVIAEVAAALARALRVIAARHARDAAIEVRLQRIEAHLATLGSAD